MNTMQPRESGLARLELQLQETRAAIDNMCALLAELQRKHADMAESMDALCAETVRVHEAPSPDCSLVW